MKVSVLGGPLDGRDVTVDGELVDLGMIDLFITDEEGIVGEPYILRHLAGENGDNSASWFAVWPPLLRPSPSDQGPPDEQVARLKASHEAMGYTMLAVCRSGEHIWTPWVQTPRGNRCRRCELCGVGQSDIF